MNGEQLSILAKIMERQAYVLGMQAENQYRQAIGESPAWNYADFSREAIELAALSEKAIKS